MEVKMLLLSCHQIKYSYISNLTKSLMYYNYIIITNINRKLVNDDPNIREAKIIETEKIQI